MKIKMPDDADVIATSQAVPGLLLLVTTPDDREHSIYYVLWTLSVARAAEHTDTGLYEIMWRGSLKSTIQEFGAIIDACYVSPDERH